MAIGSTVVCMSAINAELGLTFNTANSNLAGGSTPTFASRFGTAGRFGIINQSSPHSMSEFRNYNAMCRTCLKTFITPYVVCSFNPSSDPSIACDLSGNGTRAEVGGFVSYSSNAWKIFQNSSSGLLKFLYNTPSANLLFNFTGEMSIDAWIYVTSADYNMIVTKQPSQGAAPNYPGNFEFRTEPSGRLNFLYQIRGGGTNYGLSYTTSTGLISLNTWYHVGVVTNGFLADRIFINGNYQGTTNINTSGCFGATNGENTSIGWRQDGYFFNGCIGQIAFYDKKMPDSTFTSNFNSQRSRFGV